MAIAAPYSAIRKQKEGPFAGINGLYNNTAVTTGQQSPPDHLYLSIPTLLLPHNGAQSDESFEMGEKIIFGKLDHVSDQGTTKRREIGGSQRKRGEHAAATKEPLDIRSSITHYRPMFHRT